MAPRTNEALVALTYDDMVKLYAKHGGERATSKAIGIPRTTLQSHFAKLKEGRFQSKRSQEAETFAANPAGIRTFILSSAQDSTSVHLDFLKNLEAYAAFRNSKIMISGFTYNKKLFEDHDKHRSYYPDSLHPYLTQWRVNIGSRLTFCGEMNTLPTAVTPLSGFETYTRDRWGVFPHPKIHLRSIPTAKGDPVKVIMTTGTVSLPNYVQKKAGIKAEFNHEIGAAFVELMPDNSFFIRHLLAEDDGSFFDLNYHVKDGQVSKTNGTVEAITFGDVHREKHDATINSALWNCDMQPDWTPMIDFLQPAYQFLHDVIDFKVRNHHNIKDPHFRFQMHVDGTDSVEESMRDAAQFLEGVTRPFCETVVVEANHDLALLKWLKTADYREDPANALYFLTLQKACYKALAKKDHEFQVLPWALKKLANLDDVRFLREDDSFTIAGGIECGMHGHNGANGTNGSTAQFSKMGKRSNTGHTHSATILDGSYIAGVSGSLDMGYNKGLSSWSHSHIVTYITGKRTIVTQRSDGLYCGDVSGLDYVK